MVSPTQKKNFFVIFLRERFTANKNWVYNTHRETPRKRREKKNRVDPRMKESEESWRERGEEDTLDAQINTSNRSCGHSRTVEAVCGRPVKVNFREIRASRTREYDVFPRLPPSLLQMHTLEGMHSGFQFCPTLSFDYCTKVPGFTRKFQWCKGPLTRLLRNSLFLSFFYARSFGDTPANYETQQLYVHS